jgi:hypothetical protein
MATLAWVPVAEGRSQTPPRAVLKPMVVMALTSRDTGYGQNGFLGTPAQGFGMLGSWGSGSITVRVCFG